MSRNNKNRSPFIKTAEDLWLAIVYFFSKNGKISIKISLALIFLFIVSEIIVPVVSLFSSEEPLENRVVDSSDRKNMVNIQNYESTRNQNSSTVTMPNEQPDVYNIEPTRRQNVARADIGSLENESSTSTNYSDSSINIRIEVIGDEINRYSGQSRASFILNDYRNNLKSVQLQKRIIYIEAASSVGR